MFTRRSLATAAIVSALSFACSAPETEGPPDRTPTESGTPAYTPDPELYPDAGDTQSCHTVTVAGLTTGTLEGSTDAAPAATGGDIDDGTWVFVKAIMYGLSDAVPAAPYLKSKIVLAGKIAQTVSQVDDGDSTTEPIATTESYTRAGAQLTITTSCPASVADETASYSVLAEGNAATLVLYRTTPTGIVGSFYEKP